MPPQIDPRQSDLFQKDDNFFDDTGPTDEFGRESILLPSAKQQSAVSQDTRSYFAPRQSMGGMASPDQLKPSQEPDPGGLRSSSSDSSDEEPKKRKQVNSRLKSPPDKIGARNTIRKVKSPTSSKGPTGDLRKRYGSREKK